MLRLVLLLVAIAIPLDASAQPRPPECANPRLNPRLYAILCTDAPKQQKQQQVYDVYQQQGVATLMLSQRLCGYTIKPRQMRVVEQIIGRMRDEDMLAHIQAAVEIAEKTGHEKWCRTIMLFYPDYFEDTTR